MDRYDILDHHTYLLMEYAGDMYTVVYGVDKPI